MKKPLFIAEKPSVAKEFARVLGIGGQSASGYMESENGVVTWCVGHLVTMSYPEVYDISYKRWSLDTLPFIPKKFKYEVIKDVKKQFDTVKSLLHRDDIDRIYVCTDSGREGEYIYRLVEQMAGVKGKKRLRVWIDSQTEEEIKKGIKEAKDLSEYDNLSSAAYLRAKEDYLIGINFSRLLTLKYGSFVEGFLNTKRCVLSVGRVMTCVLGMVVNRERSIRDFKKTVFYRVISHLNLRGSIFEAEWHVTPDSRYYMTPFICKDNGFVNREKAGELIEEQSKNPPVEALVVNIEKKQEKKSPPLLYNLAELQNECSKRLKLAPDETLKIVQELYEKKMVTYPRTDARVLSTAVAKEIEKNIKGLASYDTVSKYAAQVLSEDTYKKIAKTKYTNDTLITDHYAIIPTGQGIFNIKNLSKQAECVYEYICRRFLSIFFPPAKYKKYSLEVKRETEHYFGSSKVLVEEGYLKVLNISHFETDNNDTSGSVKNSEEENEKSAGADLQKALQALKKGEKVPIDKFSIKEGETTPPKRYNSGSIILAMENAGSLIEDEELRAQIKGSGIGTSATRAEILKKLILINYLNLNKKTQIITPTLLGEVVYDVVKYSINQMLNPDFTASWEKGLSMVADGKIREDEYMQKLERFIALKCVHVKSLTGISDIRSMAGSIKKFYK